MNFPRASGVLLHPTSLPGPYGIGEIGPEAYRFADFLAETGQRLWQILPLGPTSYGDSPYQSPSTFAGNPLWVSFDVLIQDGLLKKEELADFPEFPAEKVDFGPVILARMEILETVCNQFAKRASKTLKEQFNAFCTAQVEWLDDYALFAALKDAHGGVPWPQWGLELAQRQADALATAREKFAKEIRRAKIIQFLFENQWQRLRAYCRERNIQLIGDIPIFVAHDSADVWANPGLFFLGPDGQPSVVAGVPPDYFSATGQLWGNPLYNWPAHKQNNYDWWTARLRRTFELVDIVRIDHFRGFEAYWEIPGNETTAINGKWVPGPNADLFHVLHERLGELPIIAEDLGVITPPVEALRDQFGFPGMRILQFAFGNDDRSAEFRPESYPAHCCVYTGTHDNDSTVGWFHSEPGEGSTRTSEDIAAERKMILDYLRTDGHEIHWDLINLGARSNGNTFVVPLQDLLGLDSSARMNTPGVASGNLAMAVHLGATHPAIRDRFAHITRATGRRH